MRFYPKKIFKEKRKKMHKQKEIPEFLRMSKLPKFSTSLESLKVIIHNY